MADQFTMRWRVIRNDLPVIRAAMLPKAEAVVAKAAQDIEAAAKGRAPVDTGTLRNSIQATKVGQAQWQVVVGADYGVHVEWGTVHAPAQPFIRPAVAAVRPGFLQALREVARP